MAQSTTTPLDDNSARRCKRRRTAGTAGSGTRTVPYGIDVIQEVQVQLAPYDVKLRNTGGSINAVTKSGTNDFHSGVYGYGRNNALVGKSVDGLKPKWALILDDYQTGASIGSPIIKNKAILFCQCRNDAQTKPTFYNAGDQVLPLPWQMRKSITNFLAKQIIITDPGNLCLQHIPTVIKFFSRIDWNINSKSTLMLRGIYTDGWGITSERSSTNFQFSSTDFMHTKT